VETATEVKAPRRYEVFNLPFPESSRTIKMREAAYVARPIKPPPLEG
jgi:hypothetical protein